jgi:hypothetical protein
MRVLSKKAYRRKDRKLSSKSKRSALLKKELVCQLEEEMKNKLIEEFLFPEMTQKLRVNNT